MINNLMVDLETLGRRAGCKVLSIGAVEFGPMGLGKEFYIALNLEQQTQLHVDSDTEAWWAKQSAEARRVFTEPKTSFVPGMNAFEDWLIMVSSAKLRNVRMWGNGSDFDCAILHAAYCAAGRDRTPWEFWNTRCYRTLKNMHKTVKLERQGTYHNALDDAKSQAEHAVAIMNTHNLWE